ncbi:MAG: hypothetical protein KVP17_003345 [Porospora cf. gigantea B]|uniref:uncharacterized protein n=1 Tax=Porospora cf. gigantea B TaxID=2853592 RepID=UPI003571F5F2|nr:MAG: hypothetical protein KVP17_003345 [Porospora cf. gigantea B]
MAIGKNKRISKGKKGGKKKAVDTFARKEMYDVMAPNLFSNADDREFCKTIVNKTAGTKVASDSLVGRVYDVNLADLMKEDDEHGYRKVKLICEEVNGRQCLTDFQGMDMTRDKLCYLVRKWHTMIEAHCDVKTADGFHLRLFCIGFTRRRPDQIKATCYAHSTQVKRVRAIMVRKMQAEAAKTPLAKVVKSLIMGNIEREILSACSEVIPVQNVFIRKVKVVKKPTFNPARFAELHTAKVDAGLPLKDGAPTNLLTAEVHQVQEW